VQDICQLLGAFEKFLEWGEVFIIKLPKESQKTKIKTKEDGSRKEEGNITVWEEASEESDDQSTETRKEESAPRNMNIEMALGVEEDSEHEDKADNRGCEGCSHQGKARNEQEIEWYHAEYSEEGEFHGDFD